MKKKKRTKKPRRYSVLKQWQREQQSTRLMDSPYLTIIWFFHASSQAALERHYFVLSLFLPETLLMDLFIRNAERFVIVVVVVVVRYKLLLWLLATLTATVTATTATTTTATTITAVQQITWIAERRQQLHQVINELNSALSLFRHKQATGTNQIVFHQWLFSVLE